MMTTAEIKKKDKPDLERLIVEHRSRLMAMRFRLSSNQLKDVREVRELKKDLSRMLTVWSQM